MSTKTGAGLKQLSYAMAQLVMDQRANQPVREPVRVVVKPQTPAGPDFLVTRESDGQSGFVWRVRGQKPQRWVRQTDFTNGEAVGYLADRLNKIGIEDELLTLGAQPGDAVAIGGDDAVIFDFAPQIDIGAELLSRRGQDNRLESLRPAVQRRRVKDAEYHAAKEAEKAVGLALTGLDYDHDDDSAKEE